MFDPKTTFCPTYFKSIWKSKALTATLSDIEPKDDSDNKDDGILNAFTTTVNPIDGIVEDVDEEEELVESKFEKMDDQDDIHTAYEKLYKLSEKHEKLYRLTTKKLSDVELDHEKLSIKFDEANQTIGALRFKNNFLVEKTKKFEAKLFQVRAQLERTSSAKHDEMLSLQKSASDQTGLGMVSLLLILLLLVLLFLFLLLIMLKLRTMMLKLIWLVRT